MIYRLPSDEMLHCHDHYRIEGGYGEPSKWIFKTKILPTDCRLISDNVASIYTNYFYDQVNKNLTKKICHYQKCAERGVEPVGSKNFWTRTRPGPGRINFF
jgi:hypothetical protein